MSNVVSLHAIRERCAEEEQIRSEARAAMSTGLLAEIMTQRTLALQLRYRPYLQPIAAGLREMLFCARAAKAIECIAEGGKPERGDMYTADIVALASCMQPDAAADAQILSGAVELHDLDCTAINELINDEWQSVVEQIVRTCRAAGSRAPLEELFARVRTELASRAIRQEEIERREGERLQRQREQDIERERAIFETSKALLMAGRTTWIR